MASKRAVSMSVVDSDAFLSMGSGSQLLYFHILLRSDDDGFCNSPRKIMRMIGASEDDMKVLLAKKFLLPFESGIVVVKHWKMHNAIRKDLYHETNYRKEKSLITEDDRGVYHLTAAACQTDNQNDITTNLDVPYTLTLQERNEPVTNPLRTRNEPVTQYNIIQSNINKSNITHRFDEFWSLYPKKVDKKKARAAFTKLDPDDTLFDTIIKALKKQKTSDQWVRGYIPNPTTWLNGERWNDDIPQPTGNVASLLTREPVPDETFGTEYLRK